MEAAHIPGNHDLSSLRIRRETRPAPRRRWLGWAVLLVLLALLVVGGGLYLFREPIFGLGPEVETGLVVAAGGSGDKALLNANGYVVARRQAGVTPKVTGRIKVMHRDLGDHVKKDEVLAELENADIQALLEEARATQWVNQLTAERDRKLAEEKVGTQSEYDLSLARARESAARVKHLEEQLENTKVRASFEGIIIVKNGEVGETVSLFGGQLSRKSGPIFVVADFREFEVEADVNESNIGNIEVGQPAEISLVAVPDRRYKGRLRQVVPTADRQKATIQVKVSLLEPDEKVYPEMSATVTFLKSGEPSTESSRVVAPEAGIVERDGRAVAFVVERGRVRRTPVEVAPAGAGRVRVLKGLAGGEYIVLSPPARLDDGNKVRPKASR